MLKKRIIFTLLYDSGNFVLSRNFRLQKVGTIDWLRKNYNFSEVAFYIDELIILDVSRENRNVDLFAETVRQISRNCFVPIAAGGGIRTLKDAHKLLRAGADKIVINSIIFENLNFVKALSTEYGRQCLVASLDVYRENNKKIKLFTQNGSVEQLENIKYLISQCLSSPVGEIYLNSMNQDGTAQGYDLELLDLFPKELQQPVILAGGAGHGEHLLKGLKDDRVDAVATANLFNFIGDGLEKARKFIVSNGIPLATWPSIADLRQNEK